MSTKPNQIDAFLNEHGALKALMAQTRQQQQVLQLVKQALPQQAGSHCHAAILQDGQVTLLVDSPVWANQLRFMSPDLLSALRKKMPETSGIKVRALPINPTDTMLRKKRKPAQRDYSATTAQKISQSASYMGTTELQAALKKLGATIKSKC